MLWGPLPGRCWLGRRRPCRGSRDPPWLHSRAVVHQFDPNMRPDDEFEPGELAHVVPGNTGRMLDPRRTPVTITGLDLERGYFMLRVEGFEDAGAVWECPFETVEHYQFARTSARAEPAMIATFRATAERFSQPLEIACDPAATAATDDQLREEQDAARRWLIENSAHVRSAEPLDFKSRLGSALLAADLDRFLDERGLCEMDRQFAARWVSSPRSGETIKGHRIVLAEMGLVPYVGTIIRDAHLFDPPWDRERRRRHIQARLAFVRALFAIRGLITVPLFRGMCCREVPVPPRNESFVAASFSVEVALSCTGQRDDTSIGVLYRQPVPIARLFMTYLETGAMNRQFCEAEAVLLWDGSNPCF